MRALILFILISSQSALAQDPNSLQYTLFTQSVSGLTPSQNLNPSVNTSSVSHQFTGDARISKDFSTEVGLIATRRDYSSIVLLEPNGQSQNLGMTFHQPEYQGSLQLTWITGAESLTVLESEGLSSSPYFQISHSLSYTHRGPYDGYRLGLNLNETRMDQPRGYFVARDFTTQRRPDILDTFSESAWFEYVLTDDVKMRGTLLYASRRQDRPDHVGEEVRLAYAINPLFSSRFSLQNIQERNTTLLDERGRFQSQSIDTELSWLMNYRVSVKIGYGIILESESDKFDGSSNQIGHDVYSLGAEFRLAEILLSSNLFCQATSAQTSEYGIQGGVQWIL